ncbi:MAG: hypothetical protein JXR76_27995 [Deltaproteobacteria bacterium]|nr:hypothetical protein [Deltaproteobacteria bacterium]
MRKFVISVCVLLSGLAMAKASYAELPAGKFRLHMSQTFVEVATGEVNPDGLDNREYGGLEIGVGMDRMGFGFGFALGGKLLLGAKVSLGQESGDWHPGSEEDHFQISGIPYLEFVFLTTRIRPFAKVMLGIEGARWEDGGGFWGLVMGGGGGLHFFLAPSVSIDADLELGFRFGTGHWDESPAPDRDFSHWRFSFATLVGLSAWL